MNADRALDASVAEKVMGWRRMSWHEFHARNRIDDYRHDELTGEWHDSAGEEAAPAEYHDDYYAPTDAWSPSTCIADAWTVLERFAWPKYCIRLQHAERHWRCDIELNGGDGPVISEAADTAALAICLAALRVAALGMLTPAPAAPPPPAPPLPE